MAKTVSQAEAELKAAALKYAAADKAYSAACEVEAQRLGGWKQFNELGHENHPAEWQTAVRGVNTSRDSMEDAAKALAAAIAAEQRAEAL